MKKIWGSVAVQARVEVIRFMTGMTVRPEDVGIVITGGSVPAGSDFTGIPPPSRNAGVAVHVIYRGGWIDDEIDLCIRMGRKVYIAWSPACATREAIAARTCAGHA